MREPRRTKLMLVAIICAGCQGPDPEPSRTSFEVEYADGVVLRASVGEVVTTPTGFATTIETEGAGSYQLEVSRRADSVELLVKHASGAVHQVSMSETEYMVSHTHVDGESWHRGFSTTPSVEELLGDASTEEVVDSSLWAVYPLHRLGTRALEAAAPPEQAELARRMLAVTAMMSAWAGGEEGPASASEWQLLAEVASGQAPEPEPDVLFAPGNICNTPASKQVTLQGGPVNIAPFSGSCADAALSVTARCSNDTLNGSGASVTYSAPASGPICPSGWTPKGYLRVVGSANIQPAPGQYCEGDGLQNDYAKATSCSLKYGNNTINFNGVHSGNGEAQKAFSNVNWTFTACYKAFLNYTIMVSGSSKGSTLASAACPAQKKKVVCNPDGTFACVAAIDGTLDTCPATNPCQPPPPASCQNKCGGSAGSCYCDSYCEQYGDCCPDYDQYCGGPPPPVCGNGVCDSGETCSNCSYDCGPCQAVCGNGVCDGSETCSSCSYDCGPCTGGSCVGYCGGNAGSCWCDPACTSYGDCCADKCQTCGGC